MRTYAEKMVPLFHPSLAHDESHIDWWARFMRQAASPNSAEAIERIWQQVDIRRILPTIQVPTLVIIGPTIRSRPSKQGATSPIGSRRPASLSCREEMTNPGARTRTRCWTRSSSS